MCDNFNAWTQRDAALAATMKNKLGRLDEILAQGIKFEMNLPFITKIVKRKSTAVLQVYLEHGWQINEPLNDFTPPPLRWALDPSTTPQ